MAAGHRPLVVVDRLGQVVLGARTTLVVAFEQAIEVRFALATHGLSRNAKSVRAAAAIARVYVDELTTQSQPRHLNSPVPCQPQLRRIVTAGGGNAIARPSS